MDGQDAVVNKDKSKSKSSGPCKGDDSTEPFIWEVLTDSNTRDQYFVGRA